MEVFKLFATMSLKDLISNPIAKIQANMKSAGNEAGSFNSKLANLGKSMMPLVAAATAVMSCFGFAVKTAAAFESQMAKVAAVSRASAEEMQLLEKSARELGATTVFSASEVGQAQEYLAMAGFSAAENIAALPSVLNLSTAAALDLGRTADISSDILSAFGLEAAEMSRVADTLVGTFTTANTNLEMLGDTMKYVAPIAKAAGMSLEETAAMAGLLGNIGIKSSQAGTVLRTMINRLGSSSGEAAELLASLGVQTKDAAGNLRSPISILGELSSAMDGMGSATQISALKMLFGEEAISGVSALIEAEGIGAISKYVEQLEGMGGVAMQVADRQSRTLAGALKGLGSAWESLSISVGKLFIPVVTKVTTVITKVVQVVDMLASTAAGAFFLKLSAVLSVAVLAFGGLLSGIIAVKIAIPFVLGALATLKAAFLLLTWPITLIILAVVTLTYIWKKNIGGIADYIKDKFYKINLVVKGVISVFKTLKDGVGEIRGELATEIKANGLVGVVTTVGKVIYHVYSLASRFYSALKNIFSSLIQDLDPLGKLLTKILHPVGTLLSYLGGLIARLIGASAATSTGKWAAFGRIIATLVTAPLQILAYLLGKVASFILNAIRLAERFGALAGSVFDKVKNTVLSVLNVFGGLKDKIAGLCDIDLFEAGKKLLNTFKDGIVAVLTLPFTVLSGLNDRFNELFDIDLFESGQKLLGTFKDGIISMISAPVDAVKGGLEKLRNLLPFSDAKEGPLSTLTLSGKRMMSTLAEGVQGGAGILQDAAADAFNNIVKPVLSFSVEGENGRSCSANSTENKESVIKISIGNVTLPEVKSSDDFITELKKIAFGGGRL